MTTTTDTGVTQVIRQARTRGALLAYETVGSGPPLLLISGLGTEHSVWEPQLEAFSRYFTVLTFDNRNTGLSQSRPVVTWIETMATDAVAVMDDAGIGSAAIAGMSMGGFIAQSIAVTFPRRVRSLILTCTAPCRPIPALRSGVAEMFFSPEYREEHHAEVQEWVGLIAKGPVDMLALAGQIIASARFDLRREVQSIDVPTLVVHGTKDLVVPVNWARWLASHIRDARLVLHQGAEFLTASLRQPE
jgi:3-oxoadipate enol-lactonase